MALAVGRNCHPLKLILTSRIRKSKDFSNFGIIGYKYKYERRKR
jgi:hypothetical protein